MKVQHYPNTFRNASSFKNLVNPFDAFFADTPFFQHNEVEKSLQPLTDVSETEDAFLVHVSLPGFNKEDIQVNIKDNFLTIEAERKVVHTENQKFLRKETFYGKVTRKFKLPDNIDNQNIKAGFVNGILDITLTKKLDEGKNVTTVTIE